MPFNVGPWEMLLILVVVLLVFGAKRLPEMGAAMGKGIREFKKNITEVKDSIENTERALMLLCNQDTRTPGSPAWG
jgi:sec-independent protein translocase protein TatA